MSDYSVVSRVRDDKRQVAANQPHWHTLQNDELLLGLKLDSPDSGPEDVGVVLRLELLRLKPSFAPTFFQPLLCAATAR